MNTYIYTLSDATGVRYVGKSNVPNGRLKNHLKECRHKRSRREKWLYSLIQRGVKPVLEILDEVDELNWQRMEMYWIAQLRAWGFDLVNGTDGGECSNGFKGKTHTEETKETIRRNRKEQQNISSCTGIKNGRSKLNWQKVDEIRTLYREGSSLTEISRMYNVSDVSIHNVVNFRNWKTRDRLEMAPAGAHNP